ncbi:autoinducer binding domain-containing protein [Parachitinimonas caeni]|uniref:Autoinducer binding domain-containing protein n=1 Tax=Parachitinimonas caeni TaxID=3031301 RepID=A0ABT7DU79_9NEIS|nr:autoinducer binding domain-containing protein [Parachitinimonas caeni]MDK2122665.1 autoinducer binding domain-containing protein [Parachitinimonas caeni]
MSNFLAELASAKSEREIRTLLRQIADHAGFETYALAVGHAPEKGLPTTVWHNFPQGWDGVGEPGMVERDPVARLVRAPNPAPVIWGQTLYWREGASDLWELFSSKGIRSGIDVPIRNPDGTRLVLTLATDQDNLPRGEELIRQMNVAVGAAHCFGAVVPGIVEAQQFAASLPRNHFDLLCYVLDGLPLEALSRRFQRTERQILSLLRQLAHSAGLGSPMAAAVLATRGTL